jgi:hypothetical protein
MFGTFDNDDDIILSLPLNDLRSILMTNQYFNNRYKPNRKLITLISKVDKLINIVNHRSQYFYLNIKQEYELYDYYLTLMNKLKIDVDERLYYKEGMVMSLAIYNNKPDETYGIEYKLFKDDIDGFEADVFATLTYLQLKEFLLQLYYNDKIINI